MKPGAVQNYYSATANIYGWEPCPRCKGTYRCTYLGNPQQVECPDCGHKENKAVEEDND